MSILFHWVCSSVAIGIAAYLLPAVTVSMPGAIVAAVVLGALNLFLRPALIILTLPINLLTLGLFSLVINALLVLLAATVVPGFEVQGFWAAFFFAIILTLVHWVMNAWRD